MSYFRSCCCVCLLAALFSVGEGLPFESYLKSRLRRSKPDTTGDPKGPEDVGQFQRKTQSPLIWLKYTKTELPEPAATWSNTPFRDFAKQAVGALRADSQSSQNAGATSEAELMSKTGSKTSSLVSGKSEAGTAASPSETAATLLMDAEMTMDHLFSLKNDISKLNARVSAGGRTAKKALARLIDLWSQPNAKILMLFKGVLFKCKKLMASQETPDDVRALAGSLITLITDVPVTSENSHETGSYGHVNIVVPRPSRIYRADKAILELEGGAAPADTEDGAYLR